MAAPHSTFLLDARYALLRSTLLCATAVTVAALLTSSVPPLSAAEHQDARGTYRQLVKDYEQAVKEFEAELARLEAKDPAEAEEYAQSWEPTSAYVDLFAQAAEEFAGTDDTVQFLLWIVENDHTTPEALSEASTAALDTLIDAHAENQGFLSSVQYIGFSAGSYGEARTLAICDRVIERADGELENAALYGRAVTRIGRGEASEANVKLAKADLVAIPADTEVGKLARSFLFELENLRIGMVAPDIADRDLDGVEFKLSDYRGKVVVLDFWGDW